MADFDNLIGDIEETQPSPSISTQDEEEAVYNAATQGTENTDQIAADNEDDDEFNPQISEIPTALQKALALQENPRISDDDEIDVEDENEDQDEVMHTNAGYEALKDLWIQELNCTELCAYDGEVVEDFIEQLSMQEDVIEDLMNQGRSTGNVDPTLVSIAASICKMDMDRLAFALADLMRIRLEKIEKYALHNRESIDKMSKNEVGYLKSYGELFQSHMERTVTDHLKKGAWKQLDAPEMIDRPNLDTYVFCNVLEEGGVIVNNNVGLDLSEEVEEDGGGRQQHFDKGSHIFVRYQVVRDLVSEGKVELLM